MHVNLIARDWELLRDFYINVFGCIPLPPERDLKGKWIDSATGLNNIRIRGIHLQLPGFEKSHIPTLEIFQYDPPNSAMSHTINHPGFAHIAFSVENVQETLEKLLEHGGSVVGEKVSVEIKNAGFIEFVYAKDPEGNIIELQTWK